MRNISSLGEIIFKIKLTVSLFLDKRVAFYLKIIPVAAIIYVIVPMDLMIGPIDDAALLIGAAQLFISLCPSELVEEHSDLLDKKKKASQTNKITIIDPDPSHESDR